MNPLEPGATVGILGGGQLGRMLALAAARLGLKTHIYAPPGDNPACQVSDAESIARYDDEAALQAFSDTIDVATIEFENVPAETLRFLERQVPVAPGSRVLETTQDRLVEKSFVRDLGIAVPPFSEVHDLAGLEKAVAGIGRPAVLKSRTLGYDGHGQAAIRQETDLETALQSIGNVPAILEAFVPFEAEISVISARSRDGTTASFDIPENRHENHILRTSTVPAAIGSGTVSAAHEIARRIADALGYVGTFAVELFLLRDARGESLLVNEIAPRVHNSGHWTLDACPVSQFEQHIRAVAGWPLGDPSRHSDACMHNLLGEEALGWEGKPPQAGSALHLYGKAEARPGRKMGHLTELKPRS